MRGIAEQHDAAVGPVRNRIAVAEHPAPPFVRHLQELARARHDMGEAVEHLLALARLVAADILLVGHEGGDQVEGAPALQRIMHHVALRPGPQRGGIPAQILRHLLERQHGAIGDMAGQADRVGRAAAGHLLAHFGAHAVGGDHGIGLVDLARLGAHQRAVGGVLVGDHALAVDERDGGMDAASLEEGVVQVGAMDDGVRITEILAEGRVDRPAEDFFATQSVHHDQRVDIDRARTAGIADAEIVHGVERVRADLDTGADLAEAVGLLEHGDGATLVGKAECGGEPADAATRHDDR